MESSWIKHLCISKEVVISLKIVMEVVIQQKRECSPTLCMQLPFLKLRRKEMKARINCYKESLERILIHIFLNTGYSSWSSSLRIPPQKMIAVMTVMKMMMKIAAAPLPQINTRKKRERRKRKKKKRRRRKRESINNLNLMRMTDSSHLLYGHWSPSPPSTCELSRKIQRIRNKVPKGALLNWDRTDGYM